MNETNERGNDIGGKSSRVQVIKIKQEDGSVSNIIFGELEQIMKLSPERECLYFGDRE